MAATLCLGLSAVHPSTCSGYPCVSGYESRQTAMFAQVAVTHSCLLDGTRSVVPFSCSTVKMCNFLLR